MHIFIAAFGRESSTYFTVRVLFFSRCSHISIIVLYDIYDSVYWLNEALSKLIDKFVKLGSNTIYFYILVDIADRSYRKTVYSFIVWKNAE